MAFKAAIQGKALFHPSVTDERLQAMSEARIGSLDNPGVCLACGEDADGVEPDAEQYECEYCGARQVYGEESAAMKMFF